MRSEESSRPPMPAGVLIMQAEFPRADAAFLVARYREQIPTAVKTRIDGYRRVQDQALSVVGSLLLTESLRFWGLPAPTSDALVYPAGKRPMLLEPAGVRFSISHSGQRVVCATSLTVEVGIDLEEKISRNIVTLQPFFSIPEWEAVEAAATPMDVFYQHWVSKEAIIKAADQVAIAVFSYLNTRGAPPWLGGQRWCLTPIPTASAYCCWLATDHPPELICQEFGLPTRPAPAEASSCRGATGVLLL